MDSSTKTNLPEKQSSPEFPMKNTKKPYILSLIFILTLIVAGIVTVTTVITIRQSSPTSKSIQAICSFAPYNHLCVSTLSSFISTNSSGGDTNFSTENIIFHSFQLSVNQLTHLANISNPNNTPALQECQALLNKEVSGLNNSVASAENLYFLTELEVNEYVKVFNRIKTYQQACLDRLEESGSTVIDEIRFNVQNTRRYMYNSRAILLNIKPILDKIYDSPSSGVNYYSKYIVSLWLSYELLIIYVPQYVFLIVLVILMFKLY